jgi:AcrR family transcriptional regulator
MAVTQQIVRIAQTTLEKASIDTAVLERLLRFELAGPQDTLDLDWAPRGLLALARSSLAEAQCGALRDLIKGTTLLNEDCAAGPQHDPVYSDVTCLFALGVQQAADILVGLSPADIIRSLPATRRGQLELFGAELPEDPADYYKAHFMALLGFAKGAAAEGLGLVQWWD